MVAIFQSGVLRLDRGVGGRHRPRGALPPRARRAGRTAGLTVVAKDVAFDTHDLSIAGGAAFTIDFKNEDPSGILHNIEIRATDGQVLQDQPTIDGGAETIYQFAALPPGTYTFICKIHPIPQMTGTLTVK